MGIMTAICYDGQVIGGNPPLRLHINDHHIH